MDNTMDNPDELEYASDPGSELEYDSDSGPAPQHHRLVGLKLYKIFINLIYFIYLELIIHFLHHNLIIILLKIIWIFLKGLSLSYYY